MKIIDNFLSETQLIQLQQCLIKDLETSQLINDYSADLPAELQTQIQIYEITGTTKTLFWNWLKEKNIVTGNCNASLRYHILHPQMYIRWHHDHEPDMMGETKYPGVTLFLNKHWNDDHGGLYLYKNHPLDTNGYFISPIENRIVFNYDDLWHGISAVNHGNHIRYSLQFFIHQDCFVPQE
jgi:hypothetical protein